MAVWNIAHRGGAGLCPENTLAAFAGAVARGCDGAELDVQLSRDGEVVVFHDYRLKPEICRGPDGSWLRTPTPLIKDLTLAELGAFDVGRPDPASPYAHAHPAMRPRDGERIPTLEDIVTVAKRATKPFHLFVELKTSFSDRTVSSAPEALAEATLAVLERQGYLDRTILVGFDWPGLLHAMRTTPGVECWFTTMPQSWFRDGPVPESDDPPSAAALAGLRHWAQTGTSPWAAGFDAVNHGGSILKAIKAAGGTGWFPFWRDVTDDAVAEARELGLKVGAWTVDDPAQMTRLIGCGLDALCTDRPDVLEEIVQQG